MDSGSPNRAAGRARARACRHGPADRGQGSEWVPGRLQGARRATRTRLRLEKGRAPDGEGARGTCSRGCRGRIARDRPVVMIRRITSHTWPKCIWHWQSALHSRRTHTVTDTKASPSGAGLPGGGKHEGLRGPRKAGAAALTRSPETCGGRDRDDVTRQGATVTGRPGDPHLTWKWE